MKVSSIGLWNIPKLPATWKISKINSRLFSSSSPTSFSLFQSERGNRSVWGCGPWGSFQMRGAFLQYSLTGPCNHAEISHLQFGDSVNFRYLVNTQTWEQGRHNIWHYFVLILSNILLGFLFWKDHVVTVMVNFAISLYLAPPASWQKPRDNRRIFPFPYISGLSIDTWQIECVLDWGSLTNWGWLKE